MIENRRSKRFLKLLILFTIIFLLTTIFTGCKDPKTADVTDDGVTNMPENESDGTQTDKISEVKFGNLRIQLLSKTLFRVEEKGKRGMRIA